MNLKEFPWLVLKYGAWALIKIRSLILKKIYLYDYLVCNFKDINNTNNRTLNPNGLRRGNWLQRCIKAVD